MDIKLFKLRGNPYYLPPAMVRDRTLSATDGPQDIKGWWTNGTREFKESVLANGGEGGHVEAVGVVIEKLDDVTLFSHEYNEKFNRHTNPQVIANKNIIETLPLRMVSKEPTEGDMVCTHWTDASHNNIPVTIDDIRDDRGIMDIIQLGFLMHRNEERIIMGGSYNPRDKRYRYLGAIPTVNISKIDVLTI